MVKTLLHELGRAWLDWRGWLNWVDLGEWLDPLDRADQAATSKSLSTKRISPARSR